MSIELSKIQWENKKAPASEKKDTLAFLNKDISFSGSGLNDRKKERFYSELNILLSAGTDIKTALELIEEEQNKKKDKYLFKNIREAVVGGKSLSESVRKSRKFTPYEYFSLQIGEESGKLLNVLSELTLYYQKRIKQKRQVISAISYPSIVLFTAFGAVVFMLKFLIPVFADVFKRFGGELPAITQFIINLSDAFTASFYYILLALAGLIFFIFSQRNMEWFRKISSALIRRIPMIGNMAEKIYLARFCSSMSLLLGAKVPLLRAIELVKQMAGYYPIEKSLDNIHDDVLKGMPFHKSLAGFSIYNKRMISLIKVGEEVNELDQIFDKIAKQYGDEVEHQTSLLSSVLEPIIIIFLGLFVGVILVAMYLPMFQFGAQFK